MGVLRIGSYHEQKVATYWKRRGWKFHFPDKIRGIRPDLIVSKNNKIAMIEVKGEKANMDTAIKQVLHLKNAANCAYLALPSDAITEEKIRICRDLGIGLISINKETKEIVPPEITKGLRSVEKKILQLKSEKPKDRKKGLLELLFRSKTLVSILTILFLNQTQQYQLHDLASRAGASASTTIRELRKVEPLDIITKTKREHIAYYRINRHGIIFDELKRIFLKFELTGEIISKALKTCDIRYALIYGSFARGTETEASDVDLLIIGDADRDLISRTIFSAGSKIGREINFILWNEDEFGDKSNQKISLLSNIKHNKVIMIKGDEHEFKKSIK